MAHVDALSRSPVDPPIQEPSTLDILTISSDDWIATVQSCDQEIARIKSILSDTDTPPVADVHKNYKLKNGRVYRVIGNNQIRWVVPRGSRWQILKSNHDDVGHFGFDKTLKRIQSFYWFPKMRRFVKKYVAACLECAHHKIPSGQRQGYLHPIEKVKIPFHTIHIDHLGPFNKSKKKNAYILAIIDAFTTRSSESIKILTSHQSIWHAH